MHPLEKFRYCPVCGSSHFIESSCKSKRCESCGFEYFINPSSANVAIIVNDKGELLVATRKREPAKGTLDLPGGFADMHETAEEGLRREVKEETGLEVTSVRYLFSMPNTYRYSNFDIPTLDMFYECRIKDFSVLTADDDIANCQWIAISDINPELFGLRSIRMGIEKWINNNSRLSV